MACPGGAAAAGAALQRLRASHDTAVLAKVPRAAFYIRDRALYTAALDVARDTGASAEARTAGFLTLLFELNDVSYVSYAELLRADTMSSDTVSVDTVRTGKAITFSYTIRAPCPGLGVISDRPGPYVSAPLPTEARESTSAAALAAIADPTTPGVVRQSARCVAAALGVLPPW